MGSGRRGCDALAGDRRDCLDLVICGRRSRPGAGTRFVPLLSAVAHIALPPPFRVAPLLFLAVTLPFVAVTLLFLAVTLLFLAVTLPFLAVTLPFLAATMPFLAVTLPFVAVTMPFHIAAAVLLLPRSFLAAA